MKMKKDHIDTTWIDLLLDMDSNIVNIKCPSMMMLICIKQHIINI